MSDWKVKIEYKNKDLETVVEKEYEFIDYTEMLCRELKRVLNDIEDAFFYFSGYKTKQEWDEETIKRFDTIRHKLLDQANAIKRLPENLSYKNIQANTMSMGELLSRTLK